MKERPILFSAPMVRAILAGTKTQTRRIVKPYEFPTPKLGQQCPPDIVRRVEDGFTYRSTCPYGKPGDRLWVRETWMPDAPRDGSWSDTAFYGCKNSPLSEIPERYRKPKYCLHRASWSGPGLVGWKPSIHMPRWASRINLAITGVRVERLNDISRDDAMAEGIVYQPDGGFSLADSTHYNFADPRFSYQSLWESINGDGAWEANPWVWVVEFKRVTA